MKVLIAGGTGLIGGALTASLLRDGHEVIALTRSPGKAHLSYGARLVGWDGRTTEGWGGLVNEVDAIVNLVGENLARWPWTPAQKQRFLDSRVNAAGALTQAVLQAGEHPKVFVQGSAVGYYGPGQEPVTEDDGAGDDFGAEILIQTEAASRPVEQAGVRFVAARSAVVLARQSIVLKMMALPVRLSVGGPLGDGRQGFSWIHIEDEVGALQFLLENEDARGAFNLSAPNPVTNGEFIRTISGVLGRPYWFPVPGILLRLVLGEMSSMVLEGQFVLPKRLLEHGYPFRFEHAGAALRDLLR